MGVLTAPWARRRGGGTPVSFRAWLFIRVIQCTPVVMKIVYDTGEMRLLVITPSRLAAARSVLDGHDVSKLEETGGTPGHP